MQIKIKLIGAFRIDDTLKDGDTVVLLPILGGG